MSVQCLKARVKLFVLCIVYYIYREKSNHDLRHSQLLATYFDTQVFDSLLAADAIEMQQKRE